MPENDKPQPYHLIIDTSSFLRLLAATPEIKGHYAPGFLSIIEVMTEMGLVKPVYTNEVVTEILNTSGIISPEVIFKIEERQAKRMNTENFNFAKNKFTKAFTRIEHLRRMYNLNAVFMTTDVGDSYLNAIKYDNELGSQTLSCGKTASEVTPDLLNEELLNREANHSFIELLKTRRIRSDIGEISCGAAALDFQKKGLKASILFQGNDVRSRAIFRANGIDPFMHMTEGDRRSYLKKGTIKQIPDEFNPHRKGFDPATTEPIKNIGCLTTTALFLPLMIRAKQENTDLFLIDPRETRDTNWYPDQYPDGCLRGIFKTFLILSSSRIGGKPMHEYDALKDLYFNQIGQEVKHEHRYVKDSYKSPWWNFVMGLNREVFIKVLSEIRSRLDRETNLLKTPQKAGSFTQRLENEKGFELAI